MFTNSPASMTDHPLRCDIARNVLPAHDSDLHHRTCGRLITHVGMMVLLLLTGLVLSSAKMPDTRAGAEIGSSYETTLPVMTTDDAVALINGREVRFSDMRDLLCETAGGAILEEIALDRLLTERMKQAVVSITDRDIDAEQDLMLKILDPDPNKAALTLQAVRRRRALGDRRFALLLKRNAMLRALVKGDVKMNETQLHEQFELLYGKRYQLRLLTCEKMDAMRSALDRIHAGESFAEVAAQVSTDAPSADRGGLIGAISVFDSSYPLSIRQMLGDLQPGDVSPIVPIDQGFAVVQMVKIIPAKPVTINEVRSEVQERTQLAQERLLMNSLASELLASAKIVILDPALNDGWTRRGATVSAGREPGQ